MTVTSRCASELLPCLLLLVQPAIGLPLQGFAISGVCDRAHLDSKMHAHSRHNTAPAIHTCCCVICRKMERLREPTYAPGRITMPEQSAFPCAPLVNGFAFQWQKAKSINTCQSHSAWNPARIPVQGMWGIVCRSQDCPLPPCCRRASLFSPRPGLVVFIRISISLFLHARSYVISPPTVLP